MCSAISFAGFYKRLCGRVVRKLIKQNIQAVWPELQGSTCLGIGYAGPYLNALKRRGAEQVVSLVFDKAALEGGNPDKPLVLGDPSHFPLPGKIINHALLIHDLEFIYHVKDHLSELHRVLVPEGQALIIVPTRLGLWSHAEWSPLGTGMPFSFRQVTQYLKLAGFDIISSREALYMPPVQEDSFFARALYAMAPFFERIGPWLFPFVGGVHMVLVCKSQYGGLKTSVKKPAKVRTGSLLPEVAS